MRLLCAIFCLVAALGLGAPNGSSELVFTDLNGVSHRPIDAGEKSASVLFFYCHDCPISNSYAPEINRIAAAYTNFSFFVVQTDPDLSLTAAKEHAQKFNLFPPVLLDPAHTLVTQVKATVTPEAIVIGKNSKILYRGRIDNLYAALGKKRSAATEHDLLHALDAITAGKPIKDTKTQAIGCLIQ
jgi:hypothetical protein